MHGHPEASSMRLDSQLAKGQPQTAAVSLLPPAHKLLKQFLLLGPSIT
jgi:hypothetical protein